jgi:hypothetical protein
VALDTAFSDLDDPRAGIVEAMEGIRMYTQTRDLDALRRTVGRMGPVRLLDPAFVAQTIPAYRLLGIEPGLALEAARRALRDAILDSWLRHDDSSGGTALDLALAIDDPAALPSAWVREMGAGPGDPLFQGRVRLVSAFLNRNWARLEAEAAELNRAYPTSYSYYWYRGLALHQLGRDGEAVAPLATYVLHARDELDYPKAIEILQSLGQPVPQ